MSDFHPVVWRLGKIEPLPNSDFLEITTVMGIYPCIIKKGQFKDGQLVSWIPYDSVLPDDQRWNFVADKRDKNGNLIKHVGNIPLLNRTIKAKRIRGAYSEGLITEAPPGFNEGDCVIDYFGLTKRVYEEELPDLKNTFDVENIKGPKIFDLSKYDLEGLGKYAYAFQDGEEVIIHEKIEGEHYNLLYTEGQLFVRSRNFFKKRIELSKWWDFPLRTNIEDRLKNYPNILIAGEIFGHVKYFNYDCEFINNKIQRNFRIFDIYDFSKKKFLEWYDVEILAKELDIPTVPILYHGPWKSDGSLNILAEGQSTFGKNVREGFVMRSNTEGWHEKLHRKIVKLKGKDYKIFKG